MVKPSSFKGMTAESVSAGGTKNKNYGLGSIEKYLEWRFKRYNHKKYHKHYSLWRENITEEQFQ